MLNSDFNITAKKTNIGNMKYLLTPEAIKKAGLISLAGAEMEFKTAPSVRSAMIEQIENGVFGFTICDEKYKSAVSWWMQTQRAFPIQTDWIVPTHGTIFSVATAIRMCCEPDDAIIVSPPVYYRYEQAATRLGRRTVYNRLIDNGGVYSFDFEDLELLFSDPKNKLYVLCNPHNPISKVWNRSDLERIAALAAKHNVLVFSDEIFAEVIFGEHECIPYCTVEGAVEHAIVATSLGKVFSFTGVNHANILIPNKKLRERFLKQRDADHYGSIDPLSYAAINGAYCEEGARWKNVMMCYVQENADTIHEFFNEHFPDVKISPFEGTFVLWVNWKKFGLDENELKYFLLNESLWDVEPGEHYGDVKYYTRLSIALPKHELQKALQALLSAARKRGLAD